MAFLLFHRLSPRYFFRTKAENNSFLFSQDNSQTKRVIPSSQWLLCKDIESPENLNRVAGLNSKKCLEGRIILISIYLCFIRWRLHQGSHQPVYVPSFQRRKVVIDQWPHLNSCQQSPIYKFSIQMKFLFQRLFRSKIKLALFQDMFIYTRIY